MPSSANVEDACSQLITVFGGHSTFLFWRICCLYAICASVPTHPLGPEETRENVRELADDKVGRREEKGDKEQADVAQDVLKENRQMLLRMY